MAAYSRAIVAAKPGPGPGFQPMKFAWIGQGVKVLSREGIDVEALMSGYGIGSPNQGLTPGVDVSGDQMILMCLLIIRAASDEGHGVGRRTLRIGTASLALRAMLSAPRLQIAITTLSRFYDLGGSGIQISLTETRDRAILYVSLDDPSQTEYLIVEEIYAMAVHIWLSYFLGRRLRLDHFVSPHAHPHLGGVHPYLGCPVRPGPATAIVFDRSALAAERAPRCDEHPLEAAVLSWASEFVQNDAILRPPVIGGSLSEAVYSRLLASDASAEDVCRDLGLSVSVLRKRLSTGGASFRGLRKAALLQRLGPMLSEGQGAEDAALSLGYSDARSLRRAVKTATGITLGELRGLTSSPSTRASESLQHIKNLSAGMEV